MAEILSERESIAHTMQVSPLLMEYECPLRVMIIGYSHGFNQTPFSDAQASLAPTPGVRWLTYNLSIICPQITSIIRHIFRFPLCRCVWTVTERP